MPLNCCAYWLVWAGPLARHFAATVSRQEDVGKDHGRAVQQKKCGTRSASDGEGNGRAGTGLTAGVSVHRTSMNRPIRGAESGVVSLRTATKGFPVCTAGPSSCWLDRLSPCSYPFTHEKRAPMNSTFLACYLLRRNSFNVNK